MITGMVVPVNSLVRSLNFATPQEEYAYELDRNDAHLMLVASLSAQSAATTPAAAMIKGFVDKAGDLRRESELQSRDGNHVAAIKRFRQIVISSGRTGIVLINS